MRKTKQHQQYGKLKRYGFVFVNKEGTYAECCEEGKALKIETDADGYKFVKDWIDCKVYLAEAVAMTFIKKMDFGVGGWYLEHVDGNKANCKADNLQWVKVDPAKDTPAPVVFYANAKIYKDSNAWFGKGDTQEQASLKDHILDTDLDRVWVFETPIRITYEAFGQLTYHDVENYMADAGYVKGDKSQFKNPVILHIDLKVDNLVADNLEWCEKDDSRYVEYDKIRKERQIDLIEKYNDGWSIPESWPHR